LVLARSVVAHRFFFEFKTAVGVLRINFNLILATMKKRIIILVIAPLLSLGTYTGLAQENSFDQGKQAYLEGRKHDAMRLFQKAVLHEKFEMKGKDIPAAHAYMALIRNEYLELKLENGTFSTIRENPGLMKSAIADINQAIEFHDKSANGLIQKASRKLIKNATQIGEIVMDSLLKLDFENKSKEAIELAALLNHELKDLSTIESDNWKLHDILGFTHYMLDEMDLAMLEFKRGREIFNKEGATEVSQLHLHNCVYSAKYHYKESKNYIEAQSATEDGIQYVTLMMQSVGDDLNKIKELSALDGTFASIKSRLENISTISSTKD
jgi:hypothetical protein